MTDGSLSTTLAQLVARSRRLGAGRSICNWDLQPASFLTSPLAKKTGEKPLWGPDIFCSQDPR